MAKALFPKHSPGSGATPAREIWRRKMSMKCVQPALLFHLFSDFSRVRYWRLLNTRKQAKAPSDGLASSITAWVRGNQMSPIHFPTAYGGVRDYSSID
jgi:spore coat protein U-like protein